MEISLKEFRMKSDFYMDVENKQFYTNKYGKYPATIDMPYEYRDRVGECLEEYEDEEPDMLEAALMNIESEAENDDDIWEMLYEDWKSNQ